MTNEYMMNDFYSELFNSEPTIKVYKFTLSLPKDQSMMLSFLIDTDLFARKGCLKRLADNPDFFECCKEGFINNTLRGWTKYEISSTIDKLVNEGYIYKRVVRDGLKQTTYLKLEPMKLKALKDEYAEYRNEKSKQPVSAFISDEGKNISLPRSKDLTTEDKKLEPINTNINTNNTISKDIVEFNNSNNVDGGRVLNGEKDFDKYICSLKNSQSQTTTSPTKKEVDENKTKSYKTIMGYINSLPYETETKEALANWYNIAGKGCVTLGHIKEKLLILERDTNNDMRLMKEAIDEATGKNWKAFFYKKPKQYSNNQINTINFKQPTKKITMADVIPFDKDPDIIVI